MINIVLGALFGLAAYKFLPEGKDNQVMPIADLPEITPKPTIKKKKEKAK